MKTPFLDTEHYDEGMTVEEVDFPGSSIKAAPFRASRIVLPAGTNTPVDQHGVTECWMVAAGSATLRLGAEEVELTCGDVVDIAPHVPHQAVNHSAENFVLFSQWWQS